MLVVIVLSGCVKMADDKVNKRKELFLICYMTVLKELEREHGNSEGFSARPVAVVFCEGYSVQIYNTFIST